MIKKLSKGGTVLKHAYGKSPLWIKKQVHQQQYANAAIQLITKDYTVHMANSMYDCNTQKELIKIYHETMLSPVEKTLMEAARQRYL
eukprot:10825915-Ditylum_brightwellii.AAC.1